MSSTSLTHPTNEAFADIKEEIEAEAAADPVKKKLGVLFWLCAGWIVLVALAATFASVLPLPNPNLGNYNSVQNAGPGWGHLLGTDDLYRDILAIDPIGAIAKLPPRRLLIGHGTDDIEVPASDARDLVAAADGRAELRLIQGAGHQLRADPRMVATLLGWLDRHR